MIATARERWEAPFHARQGHWTDFRDNRRDSRFRSGLAPIGAVIATAPVATSMEENDGTFYSTYGWHPRSVAAAIATLRDLKANRRRLLAGVA